MPAEPGPSSGPPAASTDDAGRTQQRARNAKRAKILSIVSASILLVALLGGAWYYWVRDGPVAESYVEVFLTDLPAGVSRVDVRIEGVYIGEDRHELGLDHSSFDLLGLHGPEGAIRVASGNVPREPHAAVRLAFESVSVTVDGAPMDAAVDKVLSVEHDFGIAEHASSAFLFDIDLDQSLRLTDDGYVFEPVVSSIYIHRYGDPGEGDSGGAPGDEPAADLFPADGGERPSVQILETRKPTSDDDGAFGGGGGGGGSKATKSTKTTTAQPGPSSTTSGTPLPTDLPTTSAPPGVLPDPGSAESLPGDPGEIGGWFIQFSGDANDPESITAIVEGVGARVVFTFTSFPAAYIFATPEQADALSQLSSVESIEPDQQVDTFLQTSLTALDLPDVQQPLLGLEAPNGDALDGRGVGVAIIDIGFDGTHPDLGHPTVSADPAFLVNYKVESLFTVDLPTTDQSSGHGTHVAGILAGRGVMDPTQRGVAPAADLYGFAIGEGSTTLWPNVALDWIAANHDQVDPPIRVVSNSWGSGSSYEPDALTTKLVEQLVAQGIVVVFAAGNDGGDGSVAKTSSQCQIPVEGVVCVAAYDDLDTGTRSGKIASYSSRGSSASPSTWPDVSAPGTDIRSTAAFFGIVTGLSPGGYTSLSGTSMATPHVSGLVALMLQADPGLDPADVESLLESHAHAFTDGGSYASSGDNRYDGSHVAKGHGLVDAYDTLSAILT